MQSLTINVKTDSLFQKVLWLLEHFKKDGLEIVEKEDIDDIRLVKETRDEEIVAFEDYLKNEN